MREIVRTMTAAGAAIWLASCAGQLEITTDWAEDHVGRMQDYQTFAWLPRGGPERIGDDGAPAVETPYATIEEQRIADAVVGYLEGRGYRHTEPEQADFLVAAYFSVEERVSLYDVDPYYAPMYDPYSPSPVDGRNGPYAYEWEEGTLVLDIVDRPTNRHVWRGVAEAPVRRYDNPAKRDARLREAVAATLDRFPPVVATPAVSAADGGPDGHQRAGAGPEGDQRAGAGPDGDQRAGGGLAEQLP